MIADDIIRIVNSRGGVVLEASMPVDDLVRIARAAEGKCTVFLKNASTLHIDDLVRIAASGRGSVILDLSRP